MNKKTGVILRIAVSTLLIILLIYIMRGKYGDIANALKKTDPALFILAFAAFAAAAIVASFRVKLIIQAQDIRITFAESLSLTLIGYFFNNFLPTAIGGDVVKAHYLSKHSRDTAGSYTAIFVDRVVGLVTMVFMAFAALVLFGAEMVDKRLAFAIYAITAAAILAVAILVNENLARRFSAVLKLLRPFEKQLRSVYASTNKYRHKGRLMTGTMVISVISQLLYFSCFGVLALSIGSRISVLDILSRLPIVSTVSLLPSINGLGIREGSTVVLFGPLIGEENALAISILMILLLLIMSVIGGLIYALSPQFKMKLSEIEKEGDGL